MSRRFMIDVSSDSLIKISFIAFFMKGCISDFLDILSLLVFGQRIEIVSWIVLVVATIFLCFGIVKLFCKITKICLLTTIFFLLVWLISGIQHPEVVELMYSYINQFFFSGLPYLFFFYYFFCRRNNSYQLELNLKFLFDTCVKRTCLVVISQTIMFILPSTDIYQDYMSAAYTILQSAIFVMAYCMYSKTKKMLPKILALISPIYMLLLGCRGAVVFYFAFMVIITFIPFPDCPNLSQRSDKKIVIILFLILAIILLQPIASLAGSMGINSRAIEKIASGEFFSDNIRLEIYAVLIAKIIANPFGCGVLADRIILPSTKLFWDIVFSHNLALELGVDFGYIGIFIFIVILIETIRSLQKTDNRVKIVLLALFCSTFLKLQVSSSLWQEPMFCAFLGVLLASKKMRNKR